jgi:hypothetical protein
MELHPEQRWPREVVVEHGDGTVSLFAGHERDGVDGIIRSRRADDVIRPVAAPSLPAEMVVEHGDGTVSRLVNVALVDGTVRGRRPDDVFRGTDCDCQHPETTRSGFAAVNVSCPLHGDA